MFIFTRLYVMQKGKKSKSRGNVIDPLEVMDQYGTDALRLPSPP